MTCLKSSALKQNNKKRAKNHKDAASFKDKVCVLLLLCTKYESCLGNFPRFPFACLTRTRRWLSTKTFLKMEEEGEHFKKSAQFYVFSNFFAKKGKFNFT